MPQAADVRSASPEPRSTKSLALSAALLLMLFATFVALGTWQVQRRAWKLDLIERVEQRIHAPPIEAPGREEWPVIDSSYEYRAVYAEGVFLNDREVPVQAVTSLGPGFWIMTPLRTTRGFTVLVNRGFVEASHKDPASRPDGLLRGPVRISGLLRMTEPRGGFLRANDPAAGRWYSRDVAAITAAKQLQAQDVAPYFIDADNRGNPGGLPIGGLTVVHFHNSHLIYAITWYTLALMAAGTAVTAGRREWRLKYRISTARR